MSTHEQAELAFGQWLRRRRRALDLTQEELARLVACSTATIKKLETEERRPSKQIAERLAEVLQVPPDERPAFPRFARGDPFAIPPNSTTLYGPVLKPAPRHNLPLQLTSFIGRDKEIAEIRRVLTPGRDSNGASMGVRLLTLVGPGGAGKTRLAIQVAAELVDEFTDGVFFVNLAPISNAALVAQTIAQSLGIGPLGAQLPLERLKSHLRRKQMLLVLDNFEQVLDAAPDLATLLSVGPDLKMLVTSRTVLHLYGEQEFSVPPLAVPDLQALPILEDLTRSAGVALFLQRAQAVCPDFLVTPVTTRAVAEICVRLDGLPLAIELAAVRCKLLPLPALLNRLSSRLALLTGGARDLPARQQTLRNTIDWSYRLLTAREQVLFARLGVFVGGWTLEAASQVCNAAGDLEFETLDGLQALVDQSLVRPAVANADVPRFTMLETIREYALERLDASGESESVRRQHAAYFLVVAEAGVTWSLQPAWLDAMQAELDNLRAALAWATTAVGGAELGLRLAPAISTWWFNRGYWGEWRDRAEGALAHADAEGLEPDAARAFLLGQLGLCLQVLGAPAAGQARTEQCLKIYQDLGDVNGKTWALQRLGRLALERGDYEAARIQLEESTALYRKMGHLAGVALGLIFLGEVAVMQEDDAQAAPLLIEGLALERTLDNPSDTAWALWHLGHVAQIQNDYGRATELHEDSLAHFRQYGPKSRGVAEALHGLGETALAQNDSILAAIRLNESLQIFRDFGNRPGMLWCLSGQAGVAALDEEPQRAARLWGAAEAMRQSIGARAAPASRATRERLMASARQQLGEAAFAVAWAEGQALTMEQAIALALQSEAEA